MAALAAVSVVAVAGTLSGAARAAFPGDNGLIAFQTNIDHVAGPLFGLPEIYVMNPDGSGKTRLTTSGAEHPAWSPDGTKIAFGTGRDGNGEIYVMNADGSKQTRLTNRPAATDTFPVWSPDGSRIAFASFTCCPSGANYDIWVMNADGTNQTNITNHPAEDVSPAWSPDGSRIAFRTNRDGETEIYAVHPDGSGLVNLTNTPASSEDDPNWSPDGSKIAFSSNRGPDLDADVYVMQADGSNQQNITNFPRFNDHAPAWSPDGQRIAFVSSRDFNDEIYVMNADGTAPTRLTNNAPPGNTLPEDWFPDWQPVGLEDTSPPVLVIPSPITADAMSPSGALVTYLASATDDVDGSVGVSCAPPPGSTFPIGTTTVTCTTTDAAGNTASASFTVHVQGASEQVADLLALVDSYGLRTLGTSLHDKLVTVQKLLATSRPREACEKLDSFLNQAEAQTGKGLTVEQAGSLVTDGEQIKAVIGC